MSFLKLESGLRGLDDREQDSFVSDIKDMKTLAVNPEPGREVCDFCTAEPTYRLYACRNFVWLKQGTLTHESVGPWAACEICARFVDAGRWAELTERALQKFKEKYGYSPYEEQHFREQFWSMHKLFKEHMIKEA